MRARREGEGNFNRNAWAYTPRATWQELEDRFAREDMGIDCKSLEDYL